MTESLYITSLGKKYIQGKINPLKMLHKPKHIFCLYKISPNTNAFPKSKITLSS